MKPELFLPTKEFKQLIGISDCELMHKRLSGELKFVKKGNAFLYRVDDKRLLLKHPLASQLINWYRERHPISIDNSPKEVESINSILSLIETILLPINKKFGDINITYGFVSYELNSYIQKHSSSGTYPTIDQHAGSELNKSNNQICKRHGIACDFFVKGFENKMNEVTQYIVKNLDFDKLYYYSESRPIHVSVGDSCERHLQLMNISEKGRRIPGRKAYGDEAITLAEELAK